METTIINTMLVICLVGVVRAETPPRANTNAVTTCIETVTPTSGESFTKLISLIRNAEKVEPPGKVEGLKWLAGKWECTARLLTKRASLTSRYIYLDRFIFSYDLFKPMNKQSLGYIIDAETTFVPPYREKDTRPVEIEINGNGFYYEVPYADCFTIKKEPVVFSNWFILEHKMTGDILVFKRLSDD